MRTHHSRSSAGATALGGLATVVGLLPVFLVGALAVQLTEELAFGAVGLGAAVAAYRATGAAAAPVLGPVVDRLGATRSIRLATLLSAVAALGLAATATNWLTLVAWLALGGVSHALVQPASNRLLANVVQPDRLGIAFGVKQSAPPAASMLAGVSVPLIALSLGWRYTFVIATVLAISVAVGAGPAPPRTEARTRRGDRSDQLQHRRVILLLAVSLGLGTATNAAAVTFYVVGAVESGSTQTFAATILSGASVAAIGSRLLFGYLSDRLIRGHLRLCGLLLGTGALGLALTAVGRPGWMATGVIITLAGSWGFNGVFWYAMVRAYPKTPGRITGAVAPGGLLGSTIGPILFGVATEAVGFRASWAMTSGVAVLASAAMLFASARLERVGRLR